MAVSEFLTVIMVIRDATAVAKEATDLLRRMTDEGRATLTAEEWATIDGRRKAAWDRFEAAKPSA